MEDRYNTLGLINKDRESIIDIIKGLGIVLVVWYHCIGMYSNALKTFDHSIFNMIEMFFMPLFMIMSGYLSFGKVGEKKWTGNKLLNWIPMLTIMLVIYWFWGKYFGNMFITYDLPFFGYIKYGVINGWNGTVTWFVWTLVCMYLIMFIFERVKKINVWIKFVVLMGLMNVIPYEGTALGINNLRWFGMFFVFGWMIKYCAINYGWWKWIKIGSIISVIAFPVLFIVFGEMNDYMQFIYVRPIHKSILYGIENGTWYISLILIMMAMLGTGMIYWIGKGIEKIKYAKGMFVYLGLSSMGIYLFHILFVGISVNYWIATPVALILSMAIGELCNRWNWSRYLILGKALDKVSI
jgi:fucose 4-O-acetylase-like acetyltransferase